MRPSTIWMYAGGAGGGGGVEIYLSWTWVEILPVFKINGKMAKII
jgi:hypothetical protein